MDLKDSELQWACDHLGHTKSVHLSHYRQMSGFIERVKMAKLILIQDLNLAGNLKGKKLEDKEVDELLAKRLAQEADAEPGVDCEHEDADVDTLLAEEEEAPIDLECIFEPEFQTDVSPSKDEIKVKKSNRQRWTDQEVDEIRMYFPEHLKCRTCPSRREVGKAIEKSRKNGGALANRFWHTIVKKISNLNKK